MKYLQIIKLHQVPGPDDHIRISRGRQVHTFKMCFIIMPPLRRILSRVYRLLRCIPLYVTPCVQRVVIDAYILATNSRGTVHFSLHRPDNLFRNSCRDCWFLTHFHSCRSEKRGLLFNSAMSCSERIAFSHAALRSNAGSCHGAWVERTFVPAALNSSQFVLGLSRMRLPSVTRLSSLRYRGPFCMSLATCLICWLAYVTGPLWHYLPS